MNGREKRVERPQFGSAGDYGSSSPFDMEFSWKHVCYTRARFPKYFFTVSGLALLVLTTFLFVRNQGYSTDPLDVISIQNREINNNNNEPAQDNSQQGMDPEVADLVSRLEDQEGRKRQIQRVCKRNNITPDKTPVVPSSFHAMLVNERYKFIYCEIPKVACTNFKRIMLIMTGEMNTTNPMELKPSDVHGELQETYLRRLDTYKPAEIRTMLNTYFKVMFVRHPLERLLSAFRNKFTMSYNKYFPYTYGRKIIRKYRTSPGERSLEKGHDVLFEEFVKYLIDLKKGTEPYNQHWREYYKLCHPCMVQYDVIGKYDTLEADVDYVLRILGVDDLIHFPPKPSLHGPSTSEMLRQSYQNISSVEIHKLWEMYAVDFAMFGYKYPDFDRV